MKKKAKIIALLIIALSLLTLNVSCGASNNSKTIKLADSSKAYEINVGDIATVVLDENASTGYTWHYIVSDVNVLKLDSDKYELPNSNKVGATGSHTWNFKAQSKGNVTLTFKYYRDWEGEQSAGKVVSYTVNVL